MASGYKRFIKQTSKCYYKQLHQNLRNLKHSKPAEYWDILNKASNSKEKYGNISQDTFMSHTEKPKSSTAANVCVIPFDPRKIMHSINKHIDRPFTQDKVLTLTKKLKSKKACNIDNVINEYLKNSPTELIVLIVKMFNLVLLSDIVPTLGSLSPCTKRRVNR